MQFHSISFTGKDPSLSALQTEFGNIHLFVYKHIRGPPNVSVTVQVISAM